MRRLWLIFALLSVAAVTTPAAACPNCRESVSSMPEVEAVTAPGSPAPEALLSSGFNASIWLMLGGVGVSLGVVGAVIIRVVRSTSTR